MPEIVEHTDAEEAEARIFDFFAVKTVNCESGAVIILKIEAADLSVLNKKSVRKEE